MKSGHKYFIVKELKLHTKPFRKAKILEDGIFIKETKSYFIFEGFRVKKNNVIYILESR